MNNKLSLNILFPVYNEEKRLSRGITLTESYLSEHADFDYVLTIVDNASTDETPAIAKQLCESSSGQIQYLRTDKKGVRAAFQAGVAANQKDIVGYMDIDISTDINHISEMMKYFDENNDSDIVNASRWSKQSKSKGRKFYRNITSHGLVLILKIIFGMKATDAICGFKFFRKAAVEQLVAETLSQNGWFYIIELLLRAERQGYSIYELPVKWVDDSANSTVKTMSLIKEYLKQIFALKKRFNMETK